MSFSGNEFGELWDEAVRQLTSKPEKDVIERASDDIRTIRAAHCLINGDEVGSSDGFGELLAQVKDEYLISPEQVLAALSIAEDRIVRE